MTATLILNGQERELHQLSTLADALAEFGYLGKHFAVAVDGRFVNRSRYADYPLHGGESIEVLSPMQGG